MGLEDLPVPTQVIITRAANDEPLIVINAWLTFKGYNPITQEGLDKLKAKHHAEIKQYEAQKSTGTIYSELVEVKDLLMNASKINEDPKALAQLVNAMNSVSKTIETLNEKEQAKKGETRADTKEFIAVIDFLDSEGYIKVNHERRKEFIRNLSETI